MQQKVQYYHFITEWHCSYVYTCLILIKEICNSDLTGIDGCTAKFVLSLSVSSFTGYKSDCQMALSI